MLSVAKVISALTAKKLEAEQGRFLKIEKKSYELQVSTKLQVKFLY